MNKKKHTMPKKNAVNKKSNDNGKGRTAEYNENVVNPVGMRPTLVLAVITTVIAALLIVANNLLKTDETVLSASMLEKCVSIMGEGEYELVNDWLAAGYKIEKPSEVNRLIRKSDGMVAFEILSNGYNKNGIDILIAMNKDGSIKDLTIVSITETPNLGTKVDNPSFLKQFIGNSEKVTDFDIITGATYSSKGVLNAINTAIRVYGELGAEE